MRTKPEPARSAIEAALRRVYDPCSIAARAPIDIYEMGLVREWTWAEGRLDVTMCITSISCTMAGHFVEAARDQLQALEGVDVVNINIDTSITWREEMMQGEARERLANQRAEVKQRIRPQQWRKHEASLSRTTVVRKETEGVHAGK